MIQPVQNRIGFERAWCDCIGYECVLEAETDQIATVMPLPLTHNRLLAKLEDF